jgi:hypothetical protein
MALKEGAMASAGAADVGLIIALGRGNATDNPLARLRTSTQSTTAMRKKRSLPGASDERANSTRCRLSRSILRRGEKPQKALFD